MNLEKRNDLNIYKIFIIFMIGSFIGSIYEEVIFYLQFKEWTVRHDVLYGPFSTLYGLGTILFIILLPKNKSYFKTFIYASLIGGVFEYLSGLLCEKMFNIHFWDYSKEIFNIGGKTTILYASIWGIVGSLFIKLIYPKLSLLIDKITNKTFKIYCIIGIILMSFNIILSYSVFIRMVNRNKGVVANNIIDKFFDNVYYNEYMYHKFPILKNKI